MLTQPQVQGYSTDSGLRDIVITEKEVMLTFLLQLPVAIVLTVGLNWW